PAERIWLGAGLALGSPAHRETTSRPAARASAIAPVMRITSNAGIFERSAAWGAVARTPVNPAGGVFLIPPMCAMFSGYLRSLRLASLFATPHFSEEEIAGQSAHFAG